MRRRQERQRLDVLKPLSSMLHTITPGHPLLGQPSLNPYSIWMWKHKHYIHMWENSGWVRSALLKIRSLAPSIKFWNGFCYINFLHTDLIWTSISFFSKSAFQPFMSDSLPSKLSKQFLSTPLTDNSPEQPPTPPLAPYLCLESFLLEQLYLISNLGKRGKQASFNPFLIATEGRKVSVFVHPHGLLCAQHELLLQLHC